jgi:lysophospholipase L1-like esterase
MVAQVSVLLNAIRHKIAVRRLLAFVITLVALLIGAHGGAPRARVLIFSTIFLVASTIWVRGQYDDDLRGRSWFLPTWLGWGCVVVGIVMVVIWHFGNADGLGLYGAIAIYFGSGAVLMRWRDTVLDERPRWLRIACALVVSGVLMYFVGAVLLGHAPVWVGGLLILVAVFGTYPVGLSGLSALAIAWLAESEQRLRTWGRWGGLAALALFLVLAGVTVAIAHSPWLLLVMGILGLLMVAQASATQADIVAIVAVLALMGVTPAAVSGPAEPVGTRGQSVLVALGDSYMSGEGASVYYSGTDDGGGDQCRRSPTSWAAMASHQPPFTGLQDLACSGATTLNVNHSTAAKPPGVRANEGVVQAGEPGTQLDQYDAIMADYAKRNVTSHPALVAVTLGGNDAGFSTVGIMCAAPGGCEEKQKLWLDSLSEVKTQLEATYAAIDQEFPSTPVVVTGYPDPIAKRDTCGDLALTKPERDFIREFVGELDGVVQAAAADHGFYYLADMKDALANAHLQLCDPLNDGQPGINFIGLRSVNGPPEQRFNPTRWAHSSFHPNERGHAAMLQTFEQWLAGTQPLASGAPVRQPVSGQAASPAVTTPCNVYTNGSDGCRPQGNSWAQQKLGGVLAIGGPLILLAALAAWWASVAFFAWRRRAWSGTETQPEIPT